LRQYSNYNDEVKSKVKYYISFFCAGVPSQNATLDIIDSMDLNIENIKSLSYRKEGWPGFFRITDKSNRNYKLSYTMTWMKLLGPRVQFRCKVCADAIGHLADIVCADGWEDFDKNGFPTFKNAPGKSLVISRTEIGEKLVQEVLDQKNLTYYRDITNFRELDQMQPGQYSKKIYFLPRRLGLLLKNKNTPSFNHEFYLLASFRSKPIAFIRNLLGILKRS
jgi:coenzyme F420 hydrogenase subunit beta